MKIKMIKEGGGFEFIEHNQTGNVNIARRIRGTWNIPPNQRYWECQECKPEKGDVAVEVGADIGIFAIHAGACGVSQYIGFEPNIQNHTCAKHNATIGRDGFGEYAIVYNWAVSNIVDDADFYEGNGITAHGLIDQGMDENKRTVHVVTLDWLFDIGIIEWIDFLKVDCNGSEAAVFDGLSDANLAKVKKISVQYHHLLDDFRPGWYGIFRQRLRDNNFNFKIQTVNEFGDSVLVAWREK